MLWMTRRSSCEHSLASACHQSSSHFHAACPEMRILTVHVLTTLHSNLELIPLMADGPIALNSKRR